VQNHSLNIINIELRCFLRQTVIFYQNGFKSDFYMFVCLLHLYSPITRNRRWRYILDESAPA